MWGWLYIYIPFGMNQLPAALEISSVDTRNFLGPAAKVFLNFSNIIIWITYISLLKYLIVDKSQIQASKLLSHWAPIAGHNIRKVNYYQSPNRNIPPPPSCSADCGEIYFTTWYYILAFQILSRSENILTWVTIWSDKVFSELIITVNSCLL